MLKPQQLNANRELWKSAGYINTNRVASDLSEDWLIFDPFFVSEAFCFVEEVE